VVQIPTSIPATLDSLSSSYLRRHLRTPFGSMVLQPTRLIVARRIGDHTLAISIDETIIRLADAADELPRRRRGRKVDVSCVYRWSTTGCKGVVLETIQVGGTRCTSREALQRFFERLSESRQAGSVGGAQPVPLDGRRTVAQRQRQAAAAGRKLDELGA
jgi:hypothetical protein